MKNKSQINNLFSDETMLNQDSSVMIFSDKKRFYLLNKASGQIQILHVLAIQKAGEHMAKDILDFGGKNQETFLFLYQNNLYYVERSWQRSDA